MTIAGRILGAPRLPATTMVCPSTKQVAGRTRKAVSTISRAAKWKSWRRKYACRIVDEDSIAVGTRCCVLQMNAPQLNHPPCFCDLCARRVKGRTNSVPGFKGLISSVDTVNLIPEQTTVKNVVISRQMATRCLAKLGMRESFARILNTCGKHLLVSHRN